MCAGEYEPIPIPVGEKHKSLRSAEAFDYSAGEAPPVKGLDSAGDVPSDRGLDSAGEAPLIIGVDGGFPRLLAQGIMPDIVLGDFDSLEKKYHPQLERFGAVHPDSLFRLPCEKDDTDTVYAARMCLERGCRELLFYGALGGRLDHTFANLQTLTWLKKQGADAYLIGKTTLAAVVSGETVLLPADYEGTFSLFALDEKVTGVTLKGMKYPLADADMTNTFPIGVSNEVNRATVCGTDGGRASVTIRGGYALMVLEKSESEVIRQKRRKLEEAGNADASAKKKRPADPAKTAGTSESSAVASSEVSEAAGAAESSAVAASQLSESVMTSEAAESSEGMPDPSLFERIPL